MDFRAEAFSGRLLLNYGSTQEFVPILQNCERQGASRRLSSRIARGAHLAAYESGGFQAGTHASSGRELTLVAEFPAILL